MQRSLPIDDGTRYRYTFYSAEGEREEKEAILSDDDNVWTAVRHLHIAEAIDKLTRDFKRFAEEQGAFADPNSSLNDMRDMLASLPHMQDMKDKLSLHLTMARDCMNRFEKSTLSAQAMVEQNCATRLTPEGQKPRTLVEEMVPLLDDRSVSNTDKVRIIALYIMYCDGVPDEDRKRLFQHARLGRYVMQAVDNLVHLGTQVVKDASSSGWDMFFKKGKRKQQPGENEFELSRYQHWSSSWSKTISQGNWSRRRIRTFEMHHQRRRRVDTLCRCRHRRWREWVSAARVRVRAAVLPQQDRRERSRAACGVQSPPGIRRAEEAATSAWRSSSTGNACCCSSRAA